MNYDLIFNLDIREINLLSLLIRVILCLLVGGILGIERGRKQRPAGFRTYMLVCLGAGFVMMTNQYVFQVFKAADPVRMGAQVISGIGFLGAGTIINTGGFHVRGITTAAGLWAAACLGLAIGIGFYEVALVGGVVVFLIMTIMQSLEEHLRRRVFAEFYIVFETDRPFRDFLKYSRERGIRLSGVQIQKTTLPQGVELSAFLTANCPKRKGYDDLSAILGEAPGVEYIEEL